jgi:hypothetical protein
MAPAIAAFFLFHAPGRAALKDSLVPDPHIGRKGSFAIPLAYTRDCTGCGESPKTLEINRMLTCIEEISWVGQHAYKGGVYNLTYVPSNTTFEIVAVNRVTPTGMNAIFSGSSPADLAVLKDGNGVLSTALLALVIQSPPFRIESSDPPQPKYYEEHKLCMNRPKSELVKLLMHVEKKGKGRVLATLYDNMAKKTDASVQKDFIRAVKSVAKTYHFSNPEPAASLIPGMAAVAVDVDPDALAYLVAAKLSLKVWDIACIDADFKDPPPPGNAPLDFAAP